MSIKVTMKIRCVSILNPNYQWFTVGNVYDVVDGTMLDDEGTSWNCIISVDFLNKQFSNLFVFELVSDTPTKPTLEQLKALKPGDKVRLGDGKYHHWVDKMKKYCNQIVTINKILHGNQSFEITDDTGWCFLLYRNEGGKLESDIVEIISNEPPTPTETIPEKKEESTVEQVTPEAFKEAVINFISKLPYTGGTVSFAICEAERARIIEGIRELDIT